MKFEKANHLQKTTSNLRIAIGLCLLRIQMKLLKLDANSCIQEIKNKFYNAYLPKKERPTFKLEVYDKNFKYHIKQAKTAKIKECNTLTS